MKLVAFAVLLLLPLAVACSPRDGVVAPSTETAEPVPSTETPRQGPTLAPVPGAFATAGGKTVRGGEGSYCWARVCVDKVGPITNVEPLIVRPGETVALDFEGGTPTTLTLTWIRVTGPPPTPGPFGRIWTGGISPSPAGTTREAPLTPGDYILNAFAAWQGRGDMSFGFHIRVQ